MKVIIAGCRHFTDYNLGYLKLEALFTRIEPSEVVSGGARGGDFIGEQYANDCHIPIRRFLADWEQFGESAGYKRNVEMAEYADALVAFWDGKSRGTAHMIAIAREKGLKVRIVKI